MENDWQKFTMTGSVQDYLSYCNKREMQETKNNQTGESDNGTNNDSAWHGNSSTAYR